MSYIKNTLIIFLLLLGSHLAYATEMETKQQINQNLRAQLPAHILKSNQLVVVDDGHAPPYIIDGNDGMTGASIDLLNAISELLGVTVKHERVGTVAAMLMGVQSGRYDFSMGPIGDNPERQKSNDFLAYAVSYYAFIVKKGNPAKIYSPQDLCGKRVALPAAGGSEERMRVYSDSCVNAQQPAIHIMTFKDQPSAFLAIRSGQADAFYGGIAILSHYVASAKNELELALTKEPGSLPDRYYSGFVAKNSPLGPVLLAALQELFDNGTYTKIMQKWGLESSALLKPGMNMAK